jgi:exopolysaccharide biosynthesis polyprenyl glycosylphosphotransferase
MGPPTTAAADFLVEGSARFPRVVRSRLRDRDRGLRRSLLLADVVALGAALPVALLISGVRAHPLLDALWILPTLPVWILLFRAYGLYKSPLRSFAPTHVDDLSSLLHALVIGTLGLWSFYTLASVARLDLVEVVAFGALAFAWVAMLRVLLRSLYLRRVGPERVFVAAPMADVRLLQRKLRNHPEYGMALVGTALIEDGDPGELGLRSLSSIEQVEELLAGGQIDHLVVELHSDFLPQETAADLMCSCFRAGVRFSAFPRARSLLYPGVEINHVEGVGLLSYHPPVLSRLSRVSKRVMDVAVASALLVLFAIPMALIAIAIKLDSEGPVFYRQTRVGRDDRHFLLLKFRTMIEGADDLVANLMEHSVDPDWLVLEEDPRITRVGRFIRRASLDELPQLWNVLAGEMSMVGPRPLPLRDDEAVRGRGRHRLDLIPGVTGYWQVLGRNSIPFREMVEIDSAYVNGWSLLRDVKLLLLTVPVVLTRRGAN